MQAEKKEAARVLTGYIKRDVWPHMDPTWNLPL